MDAACRPTLASFTPTGGKAVSGRGVEGAPLGLVRESVSRGDRSGRPHL